MNDLIKEGYSLYVDKVTGALYLKDPNDITSAESVSLRRVVLTEEHKALNDVGAYVWAAAEAKEGYDHRR